MKNYLWEMLASIKNGQVAKRSYVRHKKKKFCESFLKILWDEGFIIGYKVSKADENNFKVFLKYLNGEPVLNNIKFASKPGRRIYYSVKQIWRINPTKIFIIFSTDRGLKTLVDCRKLKIGGEPIVLIN